ncbi:unnamed protein product [Musa acuminata subsp. malaccensis]|nr:unnamed protein product [Musa acuminata subsp. malaccensis]
MKGYFLKLIHTFEEFKNLLAPSEKYHLFYLKEAMKGLSRSYLEENKWAFKHYVPNLEEHMQISLISSAYPLLVCASFVGRGEVVTCTCD